MKVVLVQRVLLAGRRPRMSLAFDRAEMEILATLSVYRFRPFRRLPVYWANVLVFGFSATAINGNEDEDQSEALEKALGSRHASYYLRRQRAEQLCERLGVPRL
jgi:hypothetical protein